MAKGEGFKGKNKKKKSSVRRNTKAYKRVDPYWAENPDKLKGKLNAAHKKQDKLQEKRKEMNPGTTNDKLRKKAIKGLVKKHGGEVNKKVYQEEEHFRENKIRYTKLPGESPTQFKQRIQDDCDVAMAEANLNKTKDNKKEKDGRMDQDLEIAKMIRTELLDTKRIKETKMDRRQAKFDGLKNSGQRTLEEKRAKEVVEKLDRQIEAAEKEFKTDKVEFGERNDDIFKTKFVPKGIKQKELRNGNFEGGTVAAIGSAKRKWSGLKMKDWTGKTMSIAEFGGMKSNNNVVTSKMRQKQIDEERARVIEAYRDMKK